MTGALLRSDTLGRTSVVRAGAVKTGQEAKSCYASNLLRTCKDMN